jgi:hypothetical protein
MVALVHNFTSKILPEGSAKAAIGGAGAGDLIFHSLCGPVESLDVSGPSSIDCKYFWGSNKKKRSCDGRGGGGRAAPRLAC